MGHFSTDKKKVLFKKCYYIQYEYFCRFLAVMPAYSSNDNALATKLVSVYPKNREYPAHQAWIMYFDPSNGNLKAVSVSCCYNTALLYINREGFVISAFPFLCRLQLNYVNFITFWVLTVLFIKFQKFSIFFKITSNNW